MFIAFYPLYITLIRRAKQSLRRSEQPLRRAKQSPWKSEQPLRRAKQSLRRSKQPLRWANKTFWRANRPLRRASKHLPMAKNSQAQPGALNQKLRRSCTGGRP